MFVHDETVPVAVGPHETFPVCGLELAVDPDDAAARIDGDQ